MIKVSCIVPAYNEGKRIRKVLEILSVHPLVDEVIVVDDGSVDDTKSVVSDFKNCHLIVHEKNKGKSHAIYTGFKAAQGEFMMLIDSDLEGLNSQNISDLLEPVLNNIADVSISLRKNAPRVWHWIGFDYISGERVFRKKILENHLEDILTLPKFGLEVFFNRWIIKYKSRVKIVLWNNVESPFKFKKVGWYKGIRGDILMIIDIFRTISIVGPIYQIIMLEKLIV